MTMKLCVECGEPTEGSRCIDHARQQPDKQTATERGYDSAWFRLSRRARKLQPWCSKCGTKDDLTGDHLVWPAKTLADVDVLCRPCNSAKGSARHTRPPGGGSDPTYKGPRGMANIPTVEKDQKSGSRVMARGHLLQVVESGFNALPDTECVRRSVVDLRQSTDEVDRCSLDSVGVPVDVHLAFHIVHDETVPGGDR